MAQIPIERKPRRRVWPWLLALMMFLAGGWAAWELVLEDEVLARGGAEVTDTRGAPDATTPPATLPAPRGDTIADTSWRPEPRAEQVAGTEGGEPGPRP